jgi:hydrogenase maturation protease
LAKILVLGIGNVLMGDEGVGVHVVRHLQSLELPENVECLDGGTGALVLLEPMQAAERIILIDATIDGSPAGTVRRLEPRYSSEYPRTLTAHDIGLKDLLDVFYLSGQEPNVVLFAVSIDPLQEMGMELSPALAGAVPRIAEMVAQEMAVTLQADRDTPSPHL